MRPAPTALLAALLFVAITAPVAAQPAFDYSRPFVATSQLGFRPGSPKTVTLRAGAAALPDTIAFFIQPVGNRLTRVAPPPEAWNTPGNVFRYPIDISEGAYAQPLENFMSWTPQPAYRGVLRREASRWGDVWQADFTGFRQPGVYQIETEYGFTAPFAIEDNPYERLERSYLEFMYAQRSGMEIPGVRPVENADDGVLDSDETIALPVGGGWNDAGDHRKWMFLTLGNLTALAEIAAHGHPAFHERALAEADWGNRFFFGMVTDSGRVYEDVGAGRNRSGDYAATWWNENHPGVTASGDHTSDNQPFTGNERRIRDQYNPLVQFLFVRHEAALARVLQGAPRSNALVLADKVWRYATRRGHDRRTIFVAEELFAAVELHAAGSPHATPAQIAALVRELAGRQEQAGRGLTGYFKEAADADGYRSIAFSGDPALALCRFLEADLPGMAAERSLAEAALKRYVEGFLMADARSNPYALTPYGVYFAPPFPEAQVFRAAGGGRGVRSFVHLFSTKPIPHGTSSVVASHAYVLARAGALLKRADYSAAAERLIAWLMGHNTAGLCLFSGVGFRHPTPANFAHYRIPDAPLVGFLGRPDDTPYIETSNAIEWSTQEIWDVPFYNLIGAVAYLKAGSGAGVAGGQR